MINKRLEADINENKYIDDEEELTGYNCPRCGYPVVYEGDFELCYHCGWAKGEEELGYWEE